ncbi:MAG: T9SS type A sorting domain-containing protein, partial [Crocinitomicaceae bacterium]
GIIVAGDAIVDNSSQFAMVRYLEDGTIDPTFGSAGKVLTEIGPNEDLCNAMALHPNDGQYILLLGESADSSSESDFAIAQYQNTVGVFSLQLDENPLIVYPNPVSDQSVIEYSLLRSERVSISLYNLQGDLVQTVLEETIQEQGDNHVLLNIDDKLPQGNYLLKVETQSSVRSIEIHM